MIQKVFLLGLSTFFIALHKFEAMIHNNATFNVGRKKQCIYTSTTTNRQL